MTISPRAFFSEISSNHSPEGEKLLCNAATVSTKLEKDQLRPQKAKTDEHIAQLKAEANDAIKGMTRYDEVICERRNLEAVREFGVAVTRAIADGNKKLAEDLGIVPPQENSPDARAFELRLKDLHGQVRSALDELDRPLSEVFESSVGFVSPTDKEISELVQRLSTFEYTAKEKVLTRLTWAREERENKKAGLMLRAASYFSRTSPDCPVCTQDLSPVPHIRQELERLSEYAHEEHLRKDIQDLCMSLVEELGNIIETPRRNESRQILSARILKDWQVLKKARFRGLLLPIGERYEQRIQRLAAEFEQDRMKRPPLAEIFLTEFPDAFSKLDAALADAWAYIGLCRCILNGRGQISKRLNALLLAQGGDDESLSVDFRTF